MQYHEQLKHPLWQKKRLEVMDTNSFQCELCGSKDEQLNVHHPFYKRGAMIWQYENHELMCLCCKCHKEEHSIDERIKDLLSNAGKYEKNIAIGFLTGLLFDDLGQMSDEYQNIGFNLAQKIRLPKDF